jgi:lipopolysaccharide/colanic/teichoic acid biosynthesis glycosyltransferase
VAVQDHGSIGQQARVKFRAYVVPYFGIGGWCKRLFDVLAAAVVLVILSPLILIVIIALKVESRGPIFLREILFTSWNRPIRIFRFRSVNTSGKAGRGHLRLSTVGKVLHRSGFDEIPQLFNVLFGEMSIVGPRPYTSRMDFSDSRLRQLGNVKPGMVAWAQIMQSRLGPRTIHQRINDDLHYVENWSLLSDIKIILMRVFSVTPYP